MNYKGKKDQKFNCACCNTQFDFKGYNGTFHKFCSIKCSGEFRKKENYLVKKKEFLNGELKSRKFIYTFLVERDSNKCSVCGITEWCDSPIRLWVDHIDGNATNNNPSNFRLICPNCDSQSNTFGGKNRGSGRRSRGLTPYG